MSIRPSLGTLLGLSTVLAGVAVAWPDDAPTRGVVAPANADRSDAQRPARTAPTPGVAQAAALPSRLPAPALEPAEFDPFAGVRPPPPRSAPPPVAPAPLATTPAAAPLAPALSYRYLGQMTDPSGQRFVYLGKGDSAIAVGVDTRLDEGYVVEAIDASSIHLRYPPLDAVAQIPIPAADPNRR